MKIVNLTPHPINIGEMVLPPSGQVARCAGAVSPHGSVILCDDNTQCGGCQEFWQAPPEEFPSCKSLPIPLIRKDLGELTGLPDPMPGTAFLVSLTCAQKAWGQVNTEEIRQLAKQALVETSTDSPATRGLMDILDLLDKQGGRDDILVVGETTRDESGRINGCKSLGVGPRGLKILPFPNQ